MEFKRHQGRGVRHARPSTTATGLLAGVCLLVLAGCSEETADATATTAAPPPAAAGAQPEAATTLAQAAPAAPAPTVTVPDAEGTVDVAELMAPGSLPDIVMGDPKAPVTIVEYASMTCGHCADFHINTLPTIKKDYIDTGKAKLILREFPLEQRALAAFMLARCAPADKRDAMVDVLFRQQDSWARAENASQPLLGIGKLAGLTQESFTACLNDKELQRKIGETQKRGEETFGVDSTPTLFVNGTRYRGSMPPASLAAVIDSML